MTKEKNNSPSKILTLSLQFFLFFISGGFLYLKEYKLAIFYIIWIYVFLISFNYLENVGDKIFSYIFFYFFIITIFLSLIHILILVNNRQFPPPPNFKTKLPLNEDKNIENEIHYKPEKEYVVDCPYCNSELTILVNKEEERRINNNEEIDYICSKCENHFSFSNKEEHNDNNKNYQIIDSYLLDRLNYLYSYTNYSNPSLLIPKHPNDYKYNYCCWLCLNKRPLFTYILSEVKICSNCTEILNSVKSKEHLLEIFSKSNVNRLKENEVRDNEKSDNYERTNNNDEFFQEDENKEKNELEYRTYLKELNKFNESQKNFIVKNYVLFCFEEFGSDFNISYLSKYFKEELDKNLPELVLKNQLDIIKKEHKEVKKKYSMSEIDSMDGLKFENLLKELFHKLGYSNINVTSKSRDGGIDIIAYKNNEKHIVQAKRYQASKTLGISAIQEVISGEREYNADKLMVITTAGKFSIDAKRKARNNSVELIDRVNLKKMLMEVDLI